MSTLSIDERMKRQGELIDLIFSLACKGDAAWAMAHLSPDEFDQVYESLQKLKLRVRTNNERRLNNERRADYKAGDK